MTKRGYSYDLDCVVLAAHFLDDFGLSVRQADIDELSQAFQDAAEDAIRALEKRARAASESALSAAQPPDWLDTSATDPHNMGKRFSPPRVILELERKLTAPIGSDEHGRLPK
jgi:hypothetical protein